MAIFNNFYPIDYYEKGFPDDIKEKADALCIVAAEGQKFINTETSSLRAKSSQYYYEIKDPRYPEGGKGKLCSAIAQEEAVWMTGTAFRIHKNVFVTAAHVVKDVLKEVDASPQDFMKLKLISGYYKAASNKSSFKPTFIEVIGLHYHSDKDICFIITENASSKYFDIAKKPELMSIRPNDVINMVGFPLGQALKFSTGEVSQIETDLHTLRGHISFFPGNSGSPILNHKTGNVIGMLTSGSTEIEDWNDGGTCYGYKTYENAPDLTANFIYAKHFYKFLLKFK